MPDTFCSLPWLHQQITSNGDIRICCYSLEDASEHNAASCNLKEAFNGETIKRVRKNMLSGKWNPECNKCRVEEEAGLTSSRNVAVTRWASIIDYNKALETTNDDGSVNTTPTAYDIRFGNFCNLKCRMCGPNFSHSWYEEWTEYHQDESLWDSGKYFKLVRNDNGRLVTDHYDWHLQESFWSQLEQNIDSIQEVYMAGGEPLLVERHEQFLKKCIELNVASRIAISYNTNLSVLPDRILDLWKNFKQVMVGASIDGMDSVLEYQRYPLRWDTALSNLKKLDNFAQEHSNIHPVIALAVTTYNAFHLPKFIWWKLFDSGFKKINNMQVFMLDQFPVIMFNMAHSPLTMNVQMYPLNIKQQLEANYKEWISKLQASNLDAFTKSKAIEILESVIKFMNSEDHSNQVPEFVKFTKFLDKQRGQDIKTVVPELGELFD